MSKKRRTFSAEYKAKVGLEALKQAEPIHVWTGRIKAGCPVWIRQLWGSMGRTHRGKNNEAEKIIKSPSAFCVPACLVPQALVLSRPCVWDATVSKIFLHR